MPVLSAQPPTTEMALLAGGASFRSLDVLSRRPGIVISSNSSFDFIWIFIDKSFV
ncbi:hypothetical protein SLEP1_g7412 [Rubroshorea leprosula]|uniref:Uncharacterized protein n=1 Tax=Rubroshorea leprosula TaxID=152421 RepID=A0AAV5I2W3_9ROSI|nr:hypothetical protein SLEP1_g7412 [Rubroshorea leprosula]